ncbi:MULTISPECIES: molybdenum cofactor guanylyltransferase MobA [Agrobacterium]|uniref:Molybdenum cofactor guanylyltransferase n=1 Tax=Agrobacterium tumefaciens TaxID=358 RepID=A0AAF0H021_AGRTU|nr:MULTISPECIES: molybdenum cofactor guanylyltransferase MobA [Agrobacterium]WGM60432.1 molybdenum cofactor guanylyltransferase MobA [Agrobacterium tumefaciens]CVI62090.1 Molybdopterin-guanine dinucleotide synthase, mobA [Agrobacterium salinitolerans str. Hayward 0363]
MTAPFEIPGLVLAGGLSRRMGSNKAMMQLGDTPLISHVINRIARQVSDVTINAANGWAESFGLPLLPDTLSGHAGPLAGILAGMRHFQRRKDAPSHFLTAPADSPFFPDDLVARLCEHLSDDAVVIAASSGQLHPVFALWPLALADDLEAWLKNDENRRIRAYLARHVTIGVAFPPLETAKGSLDPFFNINTPDELALARGYLENLE